MRCYNCENSIRANNWGCSQMPECLMRDAERRELYSTFDIHVGCKIRFKGEKRFYTVVACDNRFIIALRNWKDRVYYTICDLEECIRGADNYDSSGGAYDYAHCPTIDLKIALYRLRLTHPIPIKKIDDREIKEYYRFKNEMLGITIEPLEISKRNFVPLDIEEVRCKRK